MKIAIIGKGNVGQALSDGLARKISGALAAKACFTALLPTKGGFE